MCSVDLPGLINVLKDVALGGAAIVTATVAVRGLRKWREELRGKANFDVARGLARATKLRDDIQSVGYRLCASQCVHLRLTLTRAFKASWMQGCGPS
jgi:hypothetical protein